MFDIGAFELLIIIGAAVFVIGPKDMPLAMRTAGRWIGKLRKVTGHFRAGIDAMVRDAELSDMEDEWKRRNAEIMARHPEAARDPGSETPPPAPLGLSGTAAADDDAGPQMEPLNPPAPPPPPASTASDDPNARETRG
ncbi:twin-arginine translocase subunit TatB [Croceicoccus sp. YJ47]|uniref:Sec-independent protein translocase subunit TatA/TatB n=1 Tax=Croceicoccus sp. YJ47 TaxID=2798724 RepID=UPI001F31D159|nr:twin-arginine translocase subunit TatB [Croceicoccus sp. YJ47]